MTQGDNQNSALEQLGILIGEWNNSHLKLNEWSVKPNHENFSPNSGKLTCCFCYQ